MRYRAAVRPGRTASLFGAIVGIGMLVVVAHIFLGSSNNTPGPPGPMAGPPSPMSGFFVLWVVVLVGIVLYQIVNAFSGNVPPTETIELDAPDALPASSGSSGTTTSQLRELEQLKQEKLITPTEYEQKRREILDALGKNEAPA